MEKGQNQPSVKSSTDLTESHADHGALHVLSLKQVQQLLDLLKQGLEHSFSGKGVASTGELVTPDRKDLGQPKKRASTIAIESVDEV